MKMLSPDARGGRYGDLGVESSLSSKMSSTRTSDSSSIGRVSGWAKEVPLAAGRGIAAVPTMAGSLDRRRRKSPQCRPSRAASSAAVADGEPQIRIPRQHPRPRRMAAAVVTRPVLTTAAAAAGTGAGEEDAGAWCSARPPWLETAADSSAGGDHEDDALASASARGKEGPVGEVDLERRGRWGAGAGVLPPTAAALGRGTCDGGGDPSTTELGLDSGVAGGRGEGKGRGGGGGGRWRRDGGRWRRRRRVGGGRLGCRLGDRLLGFHPLLPV